MSEQDTQSEFANANDGDQQTENEGADRAAQEHRMLLWHWKWKMPS